MFVHSQLHDHATYVNWLAFASRLALYRPFHNNTYLYTLAKLNPPMNHDALNSATLRKNGKNVVISLVSMVQFLHHLLRRIVLARQNTAHLSLLLMEFSYVHFITIQNEAIATLILMEYLDRQYRLHVAQLTRSLLRLLQNTLWRLPHKLEFEHV